MFGQGISREGDILDLAAEVDIVKKKSGAWYSYNDIRIGQGREKLKRVFKKQSGISFRNRNACT